jgi:hypothetical protein
MRLSFVLSRCRARGPCLLCGELSTRERHQLQSISRRSGALRTEAKGESSANALAVGLREQRRSLRDVTESNDRGTHEVRRNGLVEDYSW